MRVAYFDCFAGISGDMVLGALLDAGVERDLLQAELDKLGIDGLRIQAQRTSRQAIGATQVHIHLQDHAVAPEEEHHLELPHGHGHEHEHEHEHDLGTENGEPTAAPPPSHLHRHSRDIIALIQRSSLAADVRDRAARIFARLAEAEASVHGADPAHVHLHEVGAMDAVADVVGAVAGLALAGAEAIYASPLRLGTGFVRCAHGRYPVPVPGVVALCQGIPCIQTDVEAELVTPTGAAIITTLAAGFGPPPPFRQTAVGYGAGKRDLAALPNLLRIRFGETLSASEHDQLVVIETNIDDMNPEVFGYLTERLLKDGARDVFITPVYMKKGRPGSLLSVLAEEPDLDRMVQTILAETTSIGVRYHRVERRKLERQSATVETPYGPVRVKLCVCNRIRRGTPEYDDCARLARQHQVPLLSVYAATRAALDRE
jgi:pyridinium-3,5-bisthiocarboxylic acid mononucleotide nickel chelatase